ncbi:MAG TPA: leucine-rich repeat domain-containing protein [Candidatus Avoscillospira avicola]|uniref:Leucine-rich repeat domain-containing protein n=1 Tax=Candidatus Avoscillospira avicola TaxID=2840706 RepID=A0A9D1DH60_9FIRM|nr:leucine-rich repeat domain-containing protein [Candidatus Avoscillospira avicola]
MKRVLKIVIPLVLVLALLGAAAWFFLFYRSDLTADFLAGRAANLVEKGRYNRAITYYNWAWSLQGEGDEIPLALAEAYAGAGNYTKAEYTLVRAIQENPEDVSLYVELCRVYVQQDKLLDAVQMLDRTADESVREELAELRPAAPTLSPENGYYSEYIEVTADGGGNDVYLTIDGEYPSMEEDLYEGPVTLPGGETMVLAIAVDETGLVSTAVQNGYTIGGVVEPVTLTDPAVDAAAREALGVTAGETLMTDDLWNIASLTLPETVADLSDLRWFTGLRTLTVQNVSGLDFTPLSQLTKLTELDLSGCTISSGSLDAIGGLTSLQRLRLNNCALTDIGALSQLTKLKELQLADNSLSEIGVLSLMLDLETVTLTNNPITSIASLSACGKLQYLDISGCDVTALAALSDKQQLTTLLAGNNTITDLSVLSGCSALSVLEVQYNLVSDISVLAQLPALTQFNGNNNQITAVPDFDEANSVLQIFRVDNNQIEDLSGLAGINSLNYVYADYNQVKTILPLADNINLIQVNVWDNPIPEEDVKALQEHSIIVNYNPNYEPPEEAAEE